MKSSRPIKIYFDSEKCLGCHSCELACAVEHSVTKNLETAYLEIQTPVQRRNVVPVAGGADFASLTVACRHCDPAPCMDACIAGAMVRVDGYVQCNTKKCVGCWMCVMVCPFDAVKPGTLASIKCDMCPDRDDFACIAACPTKALFAMTGPEFDAYCNAKRFVKKGSLR